MPHFALEVFFWVTTKFPSLEMLSSYPFLPNIEPMKVPLLSIESVPTRILFLYPTKLRIPSLSIEVERKCHSIGRDSPEGIGTDHCIGEGLEKICSISVICWAFPKRNPNRNRKIVEERYLISLVS